MSVQYGATVYDHICFNGLLWGLQAQFHLEDLMLSKGNRICLFVHLFVFENTNTQATFHPWIGLCLIEYTQK